MKHEFTMFGWKSESPRRDGDKPKTPPRQQPPRDDDKDYGDGDIATPKPDRYVN